MNLKLAQMWAAAGGVGVCASLACANPGTGMLWVVGSHLFLGNLVIGIVEGIAVAVVFRFNLVVSMLLLVVANYLSGWIGMFALVGIQQGIVYSTAEYAIDAALPSVVATVLASFALCFLLEFPAFWVISQWKSSSVRKAMIACIAINLPTNAMVWGVFLDNARLSLVTQTHRATPEVVLADAPAFELYVISVGHQRVEHIAWDGVALSRTQTPASPANVFGAHDSLLPERLDASEAERREAITHIVVYVSESMPRYPIVETMGIGPIYRNNPRDGYPELRDPLDDFEVILGNMYADSRTGSDRSWRPSCFRGDDAVRIFAVGDVPIATLGWMIPTDVWLFNRVLALPGDVLVVEVADQILAIHVPTMRMAPIARGSSPVVLLKENPDALVTPSSDAD